VGAHLERGQGKLTAGPAGASLLVARGLVKRYGDVEVVRGVDFALPPSGFVTILGPSGCGKTTILRMIAGFENVAEGELLLEGMPLHDRPANRRPVNTVFQNYALFPHLTVLENVAFGLRLRRLPDAESRARTALATVRLDGLESRYPRQLSGGQQQRVAVARAFVNEPRLLLLDEPLGALDLKMRRHMQVELKDIQRRLGLAFLHVTHDQEEAFALSDHVIVMNRGRIEQQGAPDAIYNEPANAFVADFIDAANLVPGEVLEVGPDTATIDTSLGRFTATASPGLSPGAAASLCIRPEKVLLSIPSSPAHAVNGIVRHSSFIGGSRVIEVEAGAVLLRARGAELPPPTIGQPLELFLPASALRIVAGRLDAEVP
jgi:spermidine/putrescine transport system ATP-binding protein